MENKKLVEVLDCTPTWESIWRIHAAVLENPQASFDGRQSAIAELNRMAQLADNRNVLVRELRQFESKAVDSIDTLLKLVDQPLRLADIENKKVILQLKKLVIDYRNAQRKENATNRYKGLADQQG